MENTEVLSNIKALLGNRPTNFRSALVYERTKDGGEIMYDVFSRLMKERIVFISGGIDADLATNVVANLLWLDSQSDKPIKMYINSPGGYVSSGLFTIYDTMQYISSDIYTYCIGEAQSAAAVLLAAGAKGHRYAFENSDIMLHHCLGGASGRVHDVLNSAEHMDKTNDKIINVLVKHTKKSKSFLTDRLKKDTFLSAEESISWGVIDHIVGKDATAKKTVVKKAATKKTVAKKVAKKKVARKR